MISKKQKQALVDQLRKTPIVQIACEKVGIGRATYYRWRKDDEEFEKASDEALGEGANLVSDVAESQLMSAIKDRNLTAIIFWLKHHHPSYRNKLELSGHIKSSNVPLTSEQEETIREALRLASLSEPYSLPPSDHE